MRLLGRSLFCGFGVVAVCAMLMGACSNASEGDRCESANGDNDCSNGLSCVVGKEICCPKDPALATTPGCQSSATPAEAGIPAEASSVDVTVVTDSASGLDTSIPPTDSGSDDASDANDDGG
ncbi:MAG: hypothetical protein ABI183_24115 [Polyangiaceae bacterium]